MLNEIEWQVVEFDDSKHWIAPARVLIHPQLNKNGSDYASHLKLVVLYNPPGLVWRNHPDRPFAAMRTFHQFDGGSTASTVLQDMGWDSRGRWVDLRRDQQWLLVHSATLSPGPGEQLEHFAGIASVPEGRGTRQLPFEEFMLHWAWPFEPTNPDPDGATNSTV